MQLFAVVTSLHCTFQNTEMRGTHKSQRNWGDVITNSSCSGDALPGNMFTCNPKCLYRNDLAIAWVVKVSCDIRSCCGRRKILSIGLRIQARTRSATNFPSEIYFSRTDGLHPHYTQTFGTQARVPRSYRCKLSTTDEWRPTTTSSITSHH